MKSIYLFCLFIISINLKSQDSTKTINVNLRIEDHLFDTRYYKNNNQIKKQDFQSLIALNKTAFSKYNQGKTFMTLGNIIGIPSTIFLLNQIQGLRENNPPFPAVFITTAMASIGGMMLVYVGESKIFESIDIFNSKNKSNTQLIMNNNGIGLAFIL